MQKNSNQSDYVILDTNIFIKENFFEGKRINELVNGIHIEKQKLKFKAKVLDDDKTFQYYGIENDSLVYLEVMK